MFEESKIFIEKYTTEVYYKRWFNKKNKNTIFILHWWWWSSDSWIKVWDLLSQKWFNVIVPDLPWFWKTILNHVFDLDDYAEFVEDFIKFFKIADFILWWHSNWWAISIKLSTRKNINIKKLVLNNSAWIRNDKKRTIKRKFFDKINTIIPESIKIKLKSSKLRTIFYKIIWWQDYINAEKNPCLKETYLNMIKSDLSRELEKIKNDTLIIWWKLDAYTPLSDWLFMKEKIKNSKMLIIDDEKHGIHLKNPEKLVKVFLENVNLNYE